MKKVINITLGSIVFAIEQDAYEALASYLEAIKSNLTNNDDANEIVADIEAAIAEKFIERKRSEKLAVTAADVDFVIGAMGSPADFGDDEVINETNDIQNTAADSKRRLYRDTDNAIIAGVASGLAQYFDIDPVIVRLIFVVSIFFNGLGILIYIILWFVVPEAATTSDKYAMRGEQVTLKDISERVKKNIQSINNPDSVAANSTWANIRDLLDKLFNLAGSIIKFIVVVARYLVGIVLVVGGALGMAAMVSVYSVILLSDKVLFPAQVQMVLETLQSSMLGIVAMASSFLTMLIPLVVLVVAGASLLAKRNFFTVHKTVSLAVVWIIAIAVAGTTSVLQVEQVMQKVGPVEGTFYGSTFQVEWEDGMIYGDDGEVRFIHQVSEEIGGPQ